MKKLLTLSIAIIAVSALSASAADAKANYESSCAKCHGADGKGQTKMGQKLGVKDYTDAKVQDALKDDAAIRFVCQIHLTAPLPASTPNTSSRPSRLRPTVTGHRRLPPRFCQ